MMAGQTLWTDEQNQRLRRLHHEGATFRQMSKELGKSRNACIGRAHRMGLPPRARDLNIRKALPKPPTVKRPQSRKVEPIRRREPTPAPVIDYSFARPWVERRFGQCAFPIGDGADALSCCAPTERVYCADCETVMFKPVQPTAQETMRISRWAA